MEEIFRTTGWICLAFVVLTIFALLVAFVVRIYLGRQPSRIVGAELALVGAGIDLTKRYDIAYAAGHGMPAEKLMGVRILGYLRSDRDDTTGEYMDSRWLVSELPDGRRAYLRPQSILWLVESAPTDLDKEFSPDTENKPV